MDIRTAFPSTYLKAADLSNQEWTLRIRSVAMEDIGGDQKPILYFEKTDKGIVLNRTNSAAIENAYGHDTDAWIGKAVVLFPATTQFQGRTVDCIRLRPHYPKANGAPGALGATPVARPQQNVPLERDDLDGDSVPF